LVVSTIGGDLLGLCDYLAFATVAVAMAGSLG
jgi:hypothetical protein